MAIKVLLHIIWVAFLTLLTQIGGLIWLLALLLSRVLRARWPLRGLTWLVFTCLYVLATLFIVPPLARLSGRVPLPAMVNPHLRPENIWFCLLHPINKAFTHCGSYSVNIIGYYSCHYFLFPEYNH